MDTLKAFEDFKNKQKVYEVMYFDMQKCVYSESWLNTLFTEIKQKIKQISCGQIRRYKNCRPFSFLSSNSSQSYF